MYVYFDANGVLKEIITERPFRAGDSIRDKIYIYWEGEHATQYGWIKFRLPNKQYTSEMQFFGPNSQMVAKQLPTKPLRNLKYFSYEHTYEENGEQKIGYLFYEVTLPDVVLNSALEEDELPTENNLVIARVRFSDGVEVSAMGSLPFAVETNIGILTDSSIDVSQYNYLIRLISENTGIYFTPWIENGILYWTNNGDRPNPEPMDLNPVSVEQVVQTKTSTESGGENEFEVRLSNGDVEGPFTVRNGLRGADGQKGEQGEPALGAMYFKIDDDTGHLIMYYANDMQQPDIHLVNDDSSSPDYYVTLGVPSNLVGHLIFMFDEI